MTETYTVVIQISWLHLWRPRFARWTAKQAHISHIGPVYILDACWIK